MAAVIHKYPLNLFPQQSVPLPPGARILSVQMQRGSLYLWALIDPEMKDPPVCHEIRVLGTGEAQGDYAWDWTHLGTVQEGECVWHVFDAGVR